MTDRGTTPHTPRMAVGHAASSLSLPPPCHCDSWPHYAPDWATGGNPIRGVTLSEGRAGRQVSKMRYWSGFSELVLVAQRKRGLGMTVEAEIAWRPR